jgi:DNA-binding NarL/FixJ family response regulator
VVLENERPTAYGITVFVEEAFADAYVGNPHPLVGKRLLRDPTPVLRPSGIAEGNTRGGLHMVVLSASYDPESPHVAAALGLVMVSTMEVLRGYRFERILNEAIRDFNIDFLSGSGAYDLARAFDEAAPGTGLRSALFVMTRERAAARKTPLLPLFVYAPPRVFFTPAEQDLLRAAMDGAPDDVISRRLGIALSATKARWTRIHQRVAARLPHILEAVPAAHDAARRGPQTRHLILSYIRENPSELTPYPRYRTNRGA